MWIIRNLLEEIKPFLKRNEFLSIVGPRQSGKTTFLEILQDYLVKKERVNKESIKIVTFEDRTVLRQFEDNPIAFVRSYRLFENGNMTYLMLDEFQYAKEGGQKLKLIYDTVKNIKIIVSGSSSLEIKAQTGKYMVGRILTFHLYPFDFGEFLRSKNKRLEKIYQENSEHVWHWLTGKRTTLMRGADVFNAEMLKLYEQYCLWGGYPAVVLSKTDKERLKVLGDIYNNYVLKDIKGLLELATDKNLHLLAQYLATQTSNIIVYHNLGQAALLDFRQLKKHLNILKETYICQPVPPFFTNRQKELTKNPKIYFFDLGFRNFLIENMNALEKRSDAGAIVENVVFSRLNSVYGDDQRINFWRTKAGAEVDFVLHRGDVVVPIEVKFSPFAEAKVPRGLASFIDYFKPGKALLLTKNYWGKINNLETEILFVPVYYL